MLDINKVSKDSRSLSDKVKESQEELNKITLTPQVLNVLGVSCSFYYIISLFILNVFILFDNHFQTFLNYRLCLVMFLTFEVTVNWIKCFKVHRDIVYCARCHSNGVAQDPPPTPDHLKHHKICDNAKFCLICQSNVPPRAYHCKVCQVCILKRNHHCYLTGRCVGFTTMRRYIVLCFYSVIGGLYTAWNVASYLGWHYIAIGDVSYESLNYILPVSFVTVFFVDSVTVFFVFLLINLYLFTGLGLLALVNFILQIILTFTGQTSYEGFKLVRRYQRDVRSNLETVFGRYIFIHFIWPFETEICGDGYHWPLR